MQQALQQQQWTCSVERFFQDSLLLLQQALHQLQWSRSAERFSLKALFSSMLQALISFLSLSGKVFLQGSLLFNATSPRQLQWIVQRKGFSLKALSYWSRSAERLFFSRLSSLQCNKPLSAAVDHLAERFFSHGSLLFSATSPRQLQWICSAERFLKGSLLFIAINPSSAASQFALW